MKEKLKTLYIQEITQAHLDFERDPEYQTYYTQAEALWEGGDMPVPSNFLSFVHGFRLGLKLARWFQKG